MGVPSIELVAADAGEASDSVDSSGSEDSGQGVAHRQHLLHNRGRHRFRQDLQDYETVGPNSLGIRFLERRSVGAKTRENYRLSNREFFSWSGLSEADLKCTKGWAKALPFRSRRPLVYALGTAIASEVRRPGAVLAGVFTLVDVGLRLG